MPFPLIDSHCHLDYLERKGMDLDQIFLNMKSQHVLACLTISTRLNEIDNLLKITRSRPNVVCSYGLHPHEANTEDVTTGILVEQTKDDDIVAIGETGLDYYYHNAPKKQQEHAFNCHIEAAGETGLPLIVHTRDADKDTIKILQHHYKQKEFSGVIHCFTASKWLGDAAIELGMAISISGIITFKKADQLRSDIASFDHQHLLIETDAPFLAPVPKRGQINEPAFIRYSADYTADLLGFTNDELAHLTMRNFTKYFKKAVQRLKQKGVDWPFKS
ncbi:MAG: TatD family hydrolase [Pseudomonadota bacterium]